MIINIKLIKFYEYLLKIFFYRWKKELNREFKKVINRNWVC